MTKLKNSFLWTIYFPIFFLIFYLPPIYKDKNISFSYILNFYDLFINFFLGFNFHYLLIVILLFLFLKILLLPLVVLGSNLKKKKENFYIKNSKKLKMIAAIKSNEKKYYELEKLYRVNKFHPLLSILLAFLSLLNIPFLLSFYIYFTSLNFHEPESFLFITNIFEPFLINLIFFNINIPSSIFFIFLSYIFWRYKFKLELYRYISLTVILFFLFTSINLPFIVIFIWFLYLLDYSLRSYSFG